MTGEPATDRELARLFAGGLSTELAAESESEVQPPQSFLPMQGLKPRLQFAT